MALTSLILAGLALGALAWSGMGIFISMALALPALVGGILGYRDLRLGGWQRLAGAGAIPLSFLALVLAWSKWALAQAVLAKLVDLM